MVDIVGVILVCCIINCVSMASLVFWGIGIGVFCAIDELISHKKVQINKWILVTLQAVSLLCTSLALLNEAPIWTVFSVAFGVCLYFILYNIKGKNRVLEIFGVSTSCFCICFAFFFVLSTVRFWLFVISLVILLGYIYYRKPDNRKDELEAV